MSADAEGDAGAVEGSADAPADADVDADAPEWPAPAGQVPPWADGLERRVWEALEDVLDLHVPISLVEMGMIYGVEVEGGAVTVWMTYPCMGCPGYEMLQGDVSDRVGAVPGVEAVDVEVVWEPIWTKDRLTTEARERLTDCGIGL